MSAPCFTVSGLTLVVGIQYQLHGGQNSPRATGPLGAGRKEGHLLARARPELPSSGIPGAAEGPSTEAGLLEPGWLPWTGSPRDLGVTFCLKGLWFGSGFPCKLPTRNT